MEVMANAKAAVESLLFGISREGAATWMCIVCPLVSAVPCCPVFILRRFESIPLLRTISLGIAYAFRCGVSR